MSLDLSLLVTQQVDVFDGNYTHNVCPMWRKARVYDALYNSDGVTACNVIEELQAGVKDMVKNKEAYEKLNPENGWGSYDTALEFLKSFTELCEKHPHGIIGVYK